MCPMLFLAIYTSKTQFLVLYFRFFKAFFLSTVSTAFLALSEFLALYFHFFKVFFLSTVSTAFLALIFAFLVLFLVSLLLSTLLNLYFWPYNFAFLGLFLIYCVHCLPGSHFRFFGPIFCEFIAIYTSKTQFIFAFLGLYLIQMPM